MVEVGQFERYRDIVDDWAGFCQALDRPLPTCVWTNTLRTTPQRLAEWMAEGGFPVEAVGWYPGAFRLPHGVQPGNRLEFVAGLYHVQEEVSLIPPALLDLAPGQRVLDLCAAPGNKTAQIAVALDNRSTVVANDRDPLRMRAVRRAIDRLGLVNVTLTTYDGANYPAESGLFDRVLVDVPCSCEGTYRKHGDMYDGGFRRLSERLAGTQAALLRKAVQLCRPGGRIVYATCTFAPEENERIIDTILGEDTAGELTLQPARIDGLRTSPGLTSWDGARFHPDLAHAMRVWPHHNDTGGFFVAVLDKRA